MLLVLNVVGQNINNGIIGYYSFDGNANDGSVYHRHGITNGAVLTKGINNIDNSAYDFTNGEIRILHQGNYNMRTLTLSAWVYIDSMGANQQNARFDNLIYGFEGSDNAFQDDIANDWMYSVESNFKFADWVSEENVHLPVCSLKTCIDVNEDSNNGWCGYYTSSEPEVQVEYNMWHHVVYEFDQGNLKFYFDGVLKYEYVDDRLTLFELRPFYGATIGADFNGKIDQLRIYNRTLSTMDINALMAERMLTVSIAGISRSSLPIFPNPSSSSINVPSSIKKYEIYSLIGTKVLEGIKGGLVNVSNLKTGSYFVKMTNSDDEAVTTTFVKK